MKHRAMQFCTLACVLVLTLSLSAMTYAQEPCDIAIGSVTGVVNDTITVCVTVANAPNMVDALGFEIAYDDTVLEYTGAWAKGDLTTGFSFFNVTNPTSGTIRVGGFTVGNEIAAGASGTVVCLDFTILACPDTTVALQNLVDKIATWGACNGEVILPETPTECGVGECASMGQLICVDGQVVDSCQPGEPSDEVCDGLDNDCNGLVDDIAPVPTECGIGECRRGGELICVDGILIDTCQPGLPSDEICDGLDNNCNGLADDIAPVPTDCGIGECASTGELACVDGVLADSCEPGTPSDEVCDGLDNDCNGLVDDEIATVPTDCGVGECASTGELTCLDGNPVDNCEPGTPSDEVCDGLDNDCDGVVDNDVQFQTYHRDFDLDGYGLTGDTREDCRPVPPYTALVGGDCNDTNPLVHPDAPEVCDGIDNDCNGLADDIAPVPTDCGIGECASTGELACVDGVLVDSCTPGAPSDEVCDGLDNNCNGLVDDGIAPVPTECGIGECSSTGVLTCVDSALVDSCTPGSPADEICDGLDNNCNGLVDDGIAPVPTECGIGECASSGQLACVAGVLVDSCTPGQPLGLDDDCNGLDENCDGLADNNYVPTETTCGEGSCEGTGQLICEQGTLVDTCVPGDGTAEVCDGIDNDCNGLVDDGIAPVPTECGVGECAAEGELVCVDGILVDTCQPGEPSEEICDDGLDNDCNGLTDMDDPVCIPGCTDNDGDGYAVEGGDCGPVDCDDTNEFVYPGADEICDDGIDNDCDGLIDEGKPIADAGDPQTVHVGSLVTLDGSGSTDLEGGPLTYLWDAIGWPVDCVPTLSVPTDVQPTFDADCVGDYDFELVVSDGLCDSEPDSVRITTENSCPVAHAGDDQSATVGQTVMLNGSACYDPDPEDIIAFLWSLIGKPAGSTAELVDPNTATPSLCIDVAGEYRVGLVVSDGWCDSEPDEMLINTTVCPIAKAGADQNACIDDLVQLNGCASYDPDGAPLTYSWSILSKPACSAAALSDATVCDPVFTADCAGDFVFQLIVNDGDCASEPDTVLVKVADCDEYLCPKSQGYWKTYPGSWPVETIVLGDETYTKAELKDIQWRPIRGDASLILAHQLITAKLNIENGSDPAPVEETIASADALLATYAGKLAYGVKPSTSEGQQMVEYAQVLDEYNNGYMTPDCVRW